MKPTAEWKLSIYTTNGDKLDLNNALVLSEDIDNIELRFSCVLEGAFGFSKCWLERVGHKWPEGDIKITVPVKFMTNTFLVGDRFVVTVFVRGLKAMVKTNTNGCTCGTRSVGGICSDWCDSRL